MIPEDYVTSNTLYDPFEPYTPTQEEEQDFWVGTGYVTFFVHQNAPDIFEIEVEEYTGCLGGLDETIGIEFALKEGYLGVDLSELSEGVTYTLHDVEVSFTRGDGWLTDDDSEYYGGELTRDRRYLKQVIHKIKMLWWRHVEYKLGKTND